MSDLVVAPPPKRVETTFDRKCARCGALVGRWSQIEYFDPDEAGGVPVTPTRVVEHVTGRLHGRCSDCYPEEL